MAGDKLCQPIGSDSRPRIVFGQGYSGISGVRTGELAQSGEALPAFAGNVFVVFRRFAIPAKYQDALPLIWVWESVGSRCAGITVFHWVYKGIQLTVFVFTRGAVVHGTTHAAPMRNVDFPLISQGSPYRTAWGTQQQDYFLGDATLRFCLFPNGF